MSIAEISPERGPRPEASTSPEEALTSHILIGIYKPEKVLTNEEIASWGIYSQSGKLLTAQDIERKTGIKQRRIAQDFETVSYMGAKAAEQALKDDRKVDFIFVSTSFPNGVNNARVIAEELGIDIQADACLDIHAACSGFTRIFDEIHNDPEKYRGKKILAIASEKYSQYLVDQRQVGALEADPALSQFLFSDGAAAMVFDDEDLEILSTSNFEISGLDGIIHMPFDEDQMVRPYLYPIDMTVSQNGKLKQFGKKVFGAVKRWVPGFIKEVHHETEETIHYIIPHQASKPVVQNGIQNELPGYPVIQDCGDGNFSSASIPMTLNNMKEKRSLKRGTVLMLVGFGAAAIGIAGTIAVIKLKK